MKVIQYLSEDGTPLTALPFSDDELRRGYRALRRARYFDERAELLQRQGKLGVYPPFRGQEAAQIGSALALQEEDWVVPTYRENAVAITHGLPLSTTLLYWQAHPAGWRFPDGVNILPFYIPIATQLPQAVGLAHALKLRGERKVVATYVGDGGSSEGDFHEALNFAAVFEVPVVFTVQNNGWAISVPTRKQMKNISVADRAHGYGMPGYLVDGNDLVAMWHTTKEAVKNAREGGGPSLIEAITYRMAPHTTSDDPKRYRDESETEVWRKRDPITRMRRLLERNSLWDEAQEEALVEALRDEFDQAQRDADAVPEPQPWEIVEHVFAEMTPEQVWAWEALHADTR